MSGVMAVPLNVTAPGATSGAAGVPFLIVPDEATLATTSAVNGQLCYVESHRSIWVTDDTSATAPSPGTVVLNPAGGRWLRTDYVDPRWLSTAHIYVDPDNTTGVANDENVAFFDAPQVGAARLPLLTWQELYRRLRRRHRLDTTDLVNLTTTIHVLSGEPLGAPASDPAEIDLIAGTDTFLRIVGEAPSTLFGPAVLTGATAQNPAVPAPGGAAATISVGATVWTPFRGRRVRRTSDGSVAIILADLGGGTARISQPVLTNESLFAATPTAVVWAIGDTIEVEGLTNVYAGRFHYDTVASALGFAGQCNWLDINFMSIAAGAFVWETVCEDQETVCVLYQCTSDRAISQDESVILNGCGLRNAPFLGTGGGRGAMYGGGIFINPAESLPIAATVWQASKQFFNFGALDYFVACQGGSVFTRGPVTLAALSIWDSVVQASLNPGGHALVVGGGPNAGAGASDLALRSSNPIFGSGSTGRGVRVAAGSQISAYGALPNITGAGGEFQLADDTEAIPLYDQPRYVACTVPGASAIAAATDVTLNPPASGSLVVAANAISLLAGMRYELIAELAAATFVGGGQTIEFGWVDAGTNVELVAGFRGKLGFGVAGADDNMTTSHVIYMPAAAQTVKVRGLAGGASTALAGFCKVFVKTIPIEPIACTWAGLALAVASGGFGGSAHNPRQNAHINQAAAT